MLTFNELLNEVKRRSPTEQLALLEELARTLRQEWIENKPLYPHFFSVCSNLEFNNNPL